MKCRICNSQDAKLYYHAVCCRACAAFFRRTIQTKKRYICSRDNSCDVTHSNRYSCRFCRMKKCRSIGMSLKLGDSSFSSDSPGTSNDVLELQLDGEKPSSSEDFYSIENVFEDYDTFLELFRDRIANTFTKEIIVKETPYYLTMCQQTSVFFKQFERKWPNCRKETLDHSNCANAKKLITKVFNVVDDAAELCMKLKPFAELPLDQKNKNNADNNKKIESDLSPTF